MEEWRFRGDNSIASLTRLYNTQLFKDLRAADGCAVLLKRNVLFKQEEIVKRQLLG